MPRLLPSVDFLRSRGGAPRGSGKPRKAKVGVAQSQGKPTSQANKSQGRSRGKAKESQPKPRKAKVCEMRERGVPASGAGPSANVPAMSRNALRMSTDVDECLR